MKRRYMLFIFLQVLVLACCSAFAEEIRPAAGLTYLTEDAPPSNYVEKGEVKGIGVDLLKNIWNRLGSPPQKIRMMPWPKAYQAAQTQPNTVLFGTARLASREQLFKWVGPIFLKRFALFAHKQSKLRAVDFEDLTKLRIGTTKDDAAEQELLRKGVPLERMVRVQGLKEQLALLETNTVDVIARDEITVRSYMEQHDMDYERIKKVRNISGAMLWYAFSKDVPDKVVQEFQEALYSLKKDGTAARVIKSYGVELSVD